MRFIVTNILWVLSNIILLFFVFFYLLSEQKLPIVVLIVSLFILIPVFFFPSTSALFAAARDWIIKKDNIGLVKNYFNHYKKNYRISILVGLILTPLWLMVIIDLYIFISINENDILSIFFLAICLFFIVYTNNIFSINVHYKMSLREILKTAFLVTIGHPVLFLTILFTNYFIFYLGFREIWFLIPFFSGSIIAFVSFSSFYQVLIRRKEKTK